MVLCITGSVSIGGLILLLVHTEIVKESKKRSNGLKSKRTSYFCKFVVPQ